ncbi:MAG: serine--tRNA ligase [Leptospirales bacterium]
MLDIRQILADPASAQAALQNRNAGLSLEVILSAERELSLLRKQWEALREQRNRLAEEIGQKKKKGEDASGRMDEARSVNAEISRLESELQKREEETHGQLLLLPNIPHTSVPVGADEQDNQEIHRRGTPPLFSFEPLPHWEIGARLGILDFDRASILSGSRFSVLRGMGSRLERALSSYMLDFHTGTVQDRPSGKPYTEVSVPLLVREGMMEGTGQFPKFRDESFAIPEDSLFLIPTAEVPLTNLHRDSIIEEALLPVKYVSCTPCFRREAGAAGKDTRGLIRQHQFLKVELVWFTRPETSYADHEELTRDAEGILEGLGLPYRRISLCTGDLGFSSAKTYDLEVWMPAQGVYREISSCSNFEGFQARRAGIRYRPLDSKKPRSVHTLNGSGLAVGRTIAAILENFQHPDGSVSIPEVLVPYMGGVRRVSLPET